MTGSKRQGKKKRGCEGKQREEREREGQKEDQRKEGKGERKGKVRRQVKRKEKEGKGEARTKHFQVSCTPRCWRSGEAVKICK